MKKRISFVLPVHNEQDNLHILYRRILKSQSKVAQKYVINFVFVNDGSRDASLSRIVQLADVDERVSVINLSRNFGHEIALTAGLDYARGDAVITMDSDLQDPPELCLKMLKLWEKGYDVVYAKRESRKNDSFFKRKSAKYFYIVLNKLSDIEIPQDVGNFRLMDKKVVNELKKFREHQRFVRGLVSYVGFKQTEVIYDRPARIHGETSYPLRKMMHLAIDGITGFSTAPIRLISRVGFFVSFLSLIGIIYALAIKFFDSTTAVPGWAFVTVSIFFIGGVQLVMLGILGNYVARIYTQTQGRPLYIVDAVYTKRSRKKA